MYKVYQMYTLLTKSIIFIKIARVAMKTITAKYARQNFSEVISEVHYSGKKVLITKSGKPMVVLVSTKENQEAKKERKGRK